MKGKRDKALSIEKFAGAKLPKWDKRDLVVRQNELKLRQKGQLNKVKKKMEAAGRLSAPAPRDFMAELDEAEERQGAPAAPKAARKRAASSDELPPAAAEDAEEPGTSGRDTAGQDAGSAHGSKKRSSAPRAVDGSAGVAARHLSTSAPHAHKAAPGEAGGKGSKHRAAGAGATAAAAAGGTAAQDKEEVAALPRGKKGSRPARPMSQLERMGKELQDKKDAEQARRDEVSRLRAEHQTKVDAAERARKVTKSNYLKKTAKGQPLMRFRVDKILSELQREAKR